jgi:regulation of enolase protein 1 (concanavalin A-like superfamily)
MMQWLNEPAQWSHSAHQVLLTTNSKTDFWRKTHYGFIRDNGHFFYRHC